MRKTFLFMSLSLDGYFEGPNHDLSWINVDDEFHKFALEQLKEADLTLYGRRTYQLMEAYWPKAAQDPKTSEDDLQTANLINNTNKIVFSRTLDKVEENDNWKNIKLIHEFDPEEVKHLKQQPGKGIGVGGSELAVSLIKNGLIDEFRFIINPVVIGQGTPIFKGLNQKLNLELIGTRTFKSGNVLHTYIPT
jgi:dihydrofolate reductase